MLFKISMRLARLSLAMVIAAAAMPSRAADEIKSVRLYALDCGHAEFKDMGFLSDTGEYDGKPGAVAVPCFLIRHPKGILLWDTGLGDKLAESKNGVDKDGIHMNVPITLVAQLKVLGLAPADMIYVASPTSTSTTPATPTSSVLPPGSSTGSS